MIRCDSQALALDPAGGFLRAPLCDAASTSRFTFSWNPRCGSIERCHRPAGLTCVGGIDEWHLNHDKPLCHFAFDLGAGFS